MNRWDGFAVELRGKIAFFSCVGIMRESASVPWVRLRQGRRQGSLGVRSDTAVGNLAEAGRTPDSIASRIPPGWEELF